jgi:hypothetical protein
MRYDAFISYSHAADGRLAPALQSALHRLARPWYRLRALRVFRDQTNLSAAPSLWPRIEAALSESRALILLASPGAAQSKWVQREIEFWRSQENAGPIYLVLTEGDPLVWEAASRGFGNAPAVPPALRGAYDDEPLWIDMTWARGDSELSLKNPRFADAAATLAAELRGVDKDTLIGEDVREHRRTRRVAAAAIVALSVLLLIAAASLFVARRQLVNARVNLAEALAGSALSTGNAPDTALLTALAASRLAQTPVTRAALLRVVQQNRHVVRMVYPHERTESLLSLAVSDRGEIAATTYAHGLYRWDARGRGAGLIEIDGRWWAAFANGRLVLASAGGAFRIDGRMIPFTSECTFDWSQPPKLAGAGRSDVVVFGVTACGEWPEKPAVTVCRLTPVVSCRTAALPRPPLAVALTGDGLWAAAVLPAEESYQHTVRILSTTAPDQQHDVGPVERVAAIAGGDGAFHVVNHDGRSERRIPVQGEAEDSIAASISAPPPRRSSFTWASTSSGLRHVAVTDLFEGIGNLDTDPTITLLERSTPNGRLSRGIVPRAVQATPPPETRFFVRDGILYERVNGREVRRSASEQELPPWRDGDDHEVHTFAVSADDATIATIAERPVPAEGLFPRIVLRARNEPPLLIAAPGTFDAMAIGAHYLAIAGSDGVFLWDRRTGAIASDAIVAGGEVRRLEFTGDDDSLVLIYSHGGAETIDLSLASLQRAACEIANRDLNDAEWRAALPTLPYEQPCQAMLGRPLEKRW